MGEKNLKVDIDGYLVEVPDKVLSAIEANQKMSKSRKAYNDDWSEWKKIADTFSEMDRKVYETIQNGLGGNDGG